MGNWVQAHYVGLRALHLRFQQDTFSLTDIVWWTGHRLSLWGYTSHTYKFLIKNAELGASSLCGVTHPTPAVPFLLREKEPKAYQRGSVLFDISSGGSIPRGCRQAAKPPPLVKNSRDRRGARDRSAVTAGAQPPGISKGCPLRHVFGYFYREIKVPAVWSA